MKDTYSTAMDILERVIPKRDPRENCFVCVMRVMEQELLAARAMNWEVALANFTRLKSTFEVYGFSDYLQWRSTCELHLGNTMAVKKAVWAVVDLVMASIQELDQRELAAELLRLAYFFTRYYMTIRCHGFSSNTRAIASGLLPRKMSVSEFRRLLKTAYSVQHPAIAHNHDEKQHIVWFAIMDSKELTLSALLRYGVMFLPSTQLTSVDLSRINTALWCLDGHSERRFVDFGSQIEVLDTCRRELSWPFHRVITVLRVLLILSFEVCESRIIDRCEREGSRLEDSREGSSSGSGYLRCLRRAFETIPEPYVTSEELRRVLQVVFDDMDERREARNDWEIAMFEKWYPDGAGPLAPRTLQHLSRCQVRQNLRQTGALPHGIRRLTLPNNIRKYIVLEE